MVDLIGFIKDERVLTYLGDRRSGVLSHMDTINRLRRDAHANDFSDAEFRDVIESIEALEQEFTAP